MKKRVVYVPLNEGSLSGTESTNVIQNVRIGRGRVIQVHSISETPTQSRDTSDRENLLPSTEILGSIDTHQQERSYTTDPSNRCTDYPSSPKCPLDCDSATPLPHSAAQEDMEGLSSEDDIPAFPVTSMYTEEELANLSDLSHSETEFISEPKNERVIEDRCRQIESRIESNFFAVCDRNAT